MLQDALLFIALIYFGYCGMLCAKHTLHISDNTLAVSLGFPLGLSIFALTTATLHQFFSLTVSSIIALFIVRLSDIRYDIRHYKGRPTQTIPPQEKQDPFRTLPLVCLILSIIFSIFVLHASQLSELPKDFLGNYPFTRSLLKGAMVFEAPFYPAHPYTGNLYYSLLIASLSPTVDNDVIRTEWILQLILQIDSFILWTWGLRLFFERALSAILGSILLNFIVATPSTIEIASLSYANLLDMVLAGGLLIVYTLTIKRNKHHWLLSLDACFIIGALTCFSILICPRISLAIFCAFLATAGAYCYRNRFLWKIFLRSAALITLATSICASTQWIYWNHLSLLQQHGFLQVHIPTRHLFSIAVPTGTEESLTQTYISLLSWESLREHALIAWFYIPIFIWCIWRRSPQGVLLAVFATVLFFIPGLLECTTRGAVSQWYWEISFDATICILCGYVCGDIYHLWCKHRGFKVGIFTRLTLISSIIFFTSEYLTQTYQTLSELYAFPNWKRYVFSPLYPSTEKWLAQIPRIALSDSEKDMTRWLRHNLDSPKRVLFSWPELSNQSAEHLALLAGSAECLPVGSDINLIWERQMRRSPNSVNRPAPGVIAFSHSGRAEPLVGLGAELLVCAKFNPAIGTKHCQLTPWQDINPNNPKDKTFAIYKVSSDFPWDKEFTPTKCDISITMRGYPNEKNTANGVAYPITLVSNRHLNGWLYPLWKSKYGNDIGHTTPLCTYIDGFATSAYLVYPYKENDYEVTWLYYPYVEQRKNSYQAYLLNGSTALSQRFSQVLESSLRVVSVQHTHPNGGTITLENISDTPLNFGTNLRLHWDIWSPEHHGYILQDTVNQAILKLPLAPKQKIYIPWHTERSIGPQNRLDISVGAPYGELYPVTRL